MRLICTGLLLICLGASMKAQEATVNGTKNSPVTILEFSDFECPFSAKAAPIIAELIRTNPGKIRLVFRHNPLPFHQHSVLAHEAALAASAQGKFWEMHNLLFANQSKLTQDDLVRYATQLQLDVPSFRHALESHVYLPSIETDIEEAKGLGVTGTPTFFINGKKLVGAQGLETFKSALDEALGVRPKAPDLNAPIVPSVMPVSAIKAAASAQVRGTDQAPVTIVEFSDFQCPFCKSAIPVLQELMRQYPGGVRWVFKNYPLDFHPDSLLAHKAALAAGEQGKFWEMHDLIFANQGTIKRDDLLQRASQLGLDMKRFGADLDGNTFQTVIDDDKAEGSRLGVTGTPTFFVNGKRMVGTRPLAEYQALVEAELRVGTRGPEATTHAATPGGLVKNTVQPVRLLKHSVTTRGPETAPVTVTWYGDLESSLSPQAARLLWQLRASYPEMIRVEFKNLPMEFHSHAGLAHQAMLSAGAQGKFWEMQQLILANQSKLTRDDLIALAKSLGLNQARFITALDTRLYQPIIDEDARDAKSHGVYGVPVFFVNEKRIDGIQPLELLRDVIDAELMKTQAIARGQ
jgi:protein-disulfide isomerase